MLTRIAHAFRTKRMRTFAGTAAVLVFLAGVVVLGSDRAHQTPLVRLHGGAAWLASNKVGQLTLLDGSSAEVAARVPVAAPGSPIRATQLGSTGYALNRWDGSIVRVDGATQQPGRPTNPLAASGDQLTTFPTAHTLYVLDSNRGLLVPVDPVDLTPRGTPQSLAAQVTSDSSAVDDDGRLWVLDQRSGDLVWFAGDVRHARPHAGTPERTRLNLAAGRPALLDLTRRVAELLDPETGEVVESVQADLRPLDKVAVSGSPQQRRLLVSVASRGLLMVCTFGAESCAAPIPLGSGGGDFGAAIETNNHAIVPDYATGRVWIVNLTTMQVVVERQLFTSPIKFELLSRDGVIFYNNPDGDQAGVLYLDGRVRAVSKYNPDDPGNVHPTNATDSRATGGQTVPTPGSSASAPPAAGPGPGTPDPPVRPMTTAIVIKPRDRGLVGEELELSVVSPGGYGISAARWTFGDGSEASGTTVRHRWDRPGEFPVNVAATFETGQPAPVSTATVVIEPAGTPPLINKINIRPEAPQAGVPAWFSAELGGARPETWEWRVTGERGSVATSNRPEFQHTFTDPGTYTATLTVRAGPASVQQTLRFVVAPAPAVVRCGDVLTTDARLTTDLDCGDDVGVTIAASNVVLDLGGHTLKTPATTRKDTAIEIKGPGVTNVTIRNGRLTEFLNGISLTDVTGVTITNVTTLSSSSTGQGTPDRGADIRGSHARDIRLENTNLTGTWAFVFDNESTARISKSTLEYHSHPATPISRAYCGKSSACTVVDSTLRMSDMSCLAGTETVETGSLTIDNSVLPAGINSYGCRTATVRDNRIGPVRFNPSGSLVFTGNTVDPGPLTGQMASLGSDGSFVISGNTFSEMTPGLAVGGHGVVSGNRFFDNPTIGLSIGSSFSGYSGGTIEITGNIFERNGNAPPTWQVERGGIVINSRDEDPQITVSNNQTRDNKGYGIYATGNVVGSGNISTNDQLNCFGVPCN
ncbi:PKD repeat protein [Kibdelosporangium banguiense]|uniref:PKD repeat protein n=1 Tax=Kibdelosporangium banguiense TaxID=1365924 RepID=A0ABS4TB15_9PSEU|nr:right-handed parallel beta-helix repeat-containing protein [Kibdelosporangium banguiense]MBP2321583.1 PKD repeat protein [Kibdelosporangium banguiense]